MSTIKVIMLGGRRTGKSSILAGIVDMLNSAEFTKYLESGDETDYTLFKGFTVKEKKLQLEYFINTAVKRNSYFLVDMMPDIKISVYQLYIKLPGKTGKLFMEFHDIPGEILDPKELGYKELIPLIKESDVFVIAIDTPYLMEAKTGENSHYNRVEELKNLLSNIQFQENFDSKLTLLVPLKCEKWAQNNELEKVNARVKEKYRILLSHLQAYNREYNMGIAITPIQTAGGIIFDHFKPAKRLIRNGINEPCAELSPGKVRMKDGRNFIYSDDYKIENDPKYKIGEIILPYAWYTAKPEGKYTPKYCEQPALHILRFLIYKTEKLNNIAPKNSTDKSPLAGWWNILQNLRNSWRVFWTGLDYKGFKETVEKMEKDGLIKETRDGFEIIQKLQ